MTRALAVLELSAGLLCLVSISRTPSESPGPRVTLDASVVLPPSRRDRASLSTHQSCSLQVAGIDRASLLYSRISRTPSKSPGGRAGVGGVLASCISP